ncbi:7425_t:CDS:2, partial [Funneliformis geosporum]
TIQVIDYGENYTIIKEIENTDNIFTIIEEVEILEIEEEKILLSPIESRASSPTLSDILTSSTIIYKPKLFAIFEQNQPQVSDEITEYLKEEKIPFN